MLSLHADFSVMRLQHVNCLSDLGQSRCPCMRFCNNAAMDSWFLLFLAFPFSRGRSWNKFFVSIKFYPLQLLSPARALSYFLSHPRAMDRWHDLELPRRVYLDCMRETVDGLVDNMLVKI